MGNPWISLDKDTRELDDVNGGRRAKLARDTAQMSPSTRIKSGRFDATDGAAMAAQTQRDRPTPTAYRTRLGRQRKVNERRSPRMVRPTMEIQAGSSAEQHKYRSRGIPICKGTGVLDYLLAGLGNRNVHNQSAIHKSSFRFPRSNPHGANSNPAPIERRGKRPSNWQVMRAWYISKAILFCHYGAKESSALTR